MMYRLPYEERLTDEERLLLAQAVANLADQQSSRGNAGTASQALRLLKRLEGCDTVVWVRRGRALAGEDA
jgi:hypothetical protein